MAAPTSKVKEGPTDDQKMWMGRIKLAMRYQDQNGNRKIESGSAGAGARDTGSWDVLRQAAAGDFNSAAELGPESIDVNMIYANMKTTLPPLWLQEPHISFKPTRKTVELEGATIDNEKNAEFAEIETNYWLKELRFREEVLRPCVIDCELTNHGYGYVGYTTRQEEITQDGEVVQPNPMIKMDAPFVRRIAPKNVLLPPGQYILDHCEWIALRFVKDYKDVLRQYDLDEDSMPQTMSIDGTESINDSALVDYLTSDDAKTVVIYQVWDKRNKKIYDIGDGCTDILDTQDWTVETEGFPVVDLTFVDIPDDYYGTPSVQYYYPQNKELNAARTQSRRRFNRHKNVTVASGEISDDFIAEYTAAPDGTIVKSGLTGDEDIRKHLWVDTGLQQDPGVLQYQGIIKSDILELSGQSSNQRGGGDPNVDSATASATIDKYVQIRATDKGDRVRSFTVNIARKLHMILAQFKGTEKRQRLIAGEIAGRFRQVEYTLDEIRGEFALDIDVSSFISENPQTRLAQANFNYNLMRADPLINPEALILDVFKAQNKPNPQQYLLFLRDPDEEMQMMMGGMPVEAHPQDRHEEHMAAHEQQMQQIEQALDQIEDPQDEQARPLRVALTLAMAHANAHAAAMQKIADVKGKQPGQPIDQNKFRNSQAVSSGRETAAEMGGNSMG